MLCSLTISLLLYVFVAHSPNYLFFLLSPLISLPFSSTDPSTSFHLLLLPHYYFSFSTHLSKATKFRRTTVPFCCLLIESLSSSDGSVRISWELENRWIDRAGRQTEKQDKETERRWYRKRSKEWKRYVLRLMTLSSALESLRAAAPLTLATSRHMVW